MVSDQVGQIALHGRHSHIHAGLAEMDGHQLRVAVRHVQQGHIAKGRYVIQAALGAGRICMTEHTQVQASRRSRTQYLQKLPLGQIHRACGLAIDGGFGV